MSIPRISLLLPSRGRPTLVSQLFSSIAATTAHLDLVEVVLYLDEDDTSSHHLDSQDFHVKRIIGPALSMGGYSSACFERASREIIILVNDDIVIRTQGWDECVRTIHSKYRDEIYLAYPNDLFKKVSFVLSRSCRGVPVNS